MGVIKSAIGIGGLLCLGIGNTLRVSLTADPVREVVAAKEILQAAGIVRRGRIYFLSHRRQNTDDLTVWPRR